MSNLILIGTTNWVMAKRIGKPITINDITHGETARVKREKQGNNTVIIIEWNFELYEIQETTAIHATNTTAFATV